jgi:hypothetical protein
MQFISLALEAFLLHWLDAHGSRFNWTDGQLRKALALFACIPPTAFDKHSRWPQSGFSKFKVGENNLSIPQVHFRLSWHESVACKSATSPIHKCIHSYTNVQSPLQMYSLLYKCTVSYTSVQTPTLGVSYTNVWSYTNAQSPIQVYSVLYKCTGSFVQVYIILYKCKCTVSCTSVQFPVQVYSLLYKCTVFYTSVQSLIYMYRDLIQYSLLYKCSVIWPT